MRRLRWRRFWGTAATAAVVCGVLVPVAAAAAEPAPDGVRLRVLVVDDGSTGVAAVRHQLEVEGVPHTVVDLADAGRPTITDAFLADGSIGRFQGVVLPSVTGMSWTSAPSLADAEVAALTAYEEAFGVRQVDAYDIPGPASGLEGIGGPGTWAGPVDEGTVATVTPAGLASGWGYLDGTVPFGLGSYAFLTTPLSSGDPRLPAGASLTPLVTLPLPSTGDPGVAVGAYRQGASERLVVTVALAQGLRQWHLLAHGVVTWLTKGVHLGHNRAYYSQHFDDAFAYDARWDVEHKCTPGEDCPPGSGYTTPDIRMTPEDVDALVAWQQESGYVPTLAFNAYYATHGQDGEVLTSPDPLTERFVAHRDDIEWLNHGYEHIYQGCLQDVTTVPWACETTDGLPVAPDGSNIRWLDEADVRAEIAQNIVVGRDVLGLPFDASEYLSGEHSGMLLVPQQPVDNPGFAAALAAEGIAVIGADASRETHQRVVGGALTVPRHPVALYYNVSTEAEEVSEYNHIYLPSWLGGSGTCEALPVTCLTAPLDPETGFAEHILPVDVANNMRFVLANDPRPYYAHVSNLTAPDYLGLQLMTAMLDTYDSWFSDDAPLVDPTLTEAAVVLGRQDAWASTGMPQGSAVEAVLHRDGTLSLTNPTGQAAPLTVPAASTVAGVPFGEEYGGERSAWVHGDVVVATPVAPPSFTSAAALVVPVGVATSVEVVAARAEALTLEGPLPAGLTFADLGDGRATIAGTATSDAVGEHPLLVTATNHWGTASQALVLQVMALPEITNAATAELRVGTAGTVPLAATGATSLAVEGALPDGVVFTDAGGGAGALTGTPAPGSAGTYALTLVATNAAGSVTQPLTLDVVAAPAIEAPASVVMTAEVPSSVLVRATGLPVPTLELVGPLPAGVTFTDHGDGTGTLGGSPAAGTAGTYPLTLRATNPVATTEVALVLEVGTELAVVSPATVALEVGVPASFAVETTGTPAPALTLTGELPPGLTFVDDGAGAGVLAGTPTQAGTWPLLVTATNAAATVTQELTVTVADGLAFLSPPEAAFVADAAGSFTVATNGATTLALVGDLPAGLTFGDSGDGSAVIEGVAARADAGPHPLTLVATRGTVTVEQPFTLTVAATPLLQLPAPPPLLVGTAGSVVVAAEGYPTPELTVSGTLPAGVTFVDAGDGTGALAGTPAAGAGGRYELTVTATSSAGTTAAPLAIDVWQAPAVTGGSFVLAAGAPAAQVFTATGWPVPTITATGTLPPGTTLTDHGDGTAELTGTPPVGSGGEYSITLRASSAAGASDTAVTLVVADRPAFVSPSVATFLPGEAGSFGIEAPGASSITLVGALPGAHALVDHGAGTATLTWTPPVGSAGVHTVTLVAENAGGTTEQVLTLQVGLAPVVTGPGGVAVTAQRPVHVEVTATGSPAPRLQLVGRLPAGLRFADRGDGTGLIFGTPHAGAAGTYSLTVRASNALGVATAPLSLTVEKLPRPGGLWTTVATEVAGVATALRNVLGVGDDRGTAADVVSAVVRAAAAVIALLAGNGASSLSARAR